MSQGTRPHTEIEFDDLMQSLDAAIANQYCSEEINALRTVLCVLENLQLKLGPMEGWVEDAAKELFDNGLWESV